MAKKILIHGATVTAMAVASVFGENCTVINHGFNCAYEYSDAYKVHSVDTEFGRFHETKKFVSDLKDKNILQNGILHPHGLAGLSASYFKKYGSKVYLGSTVEKIEENADGVTAVFYLNGEQITVRADFLIDTADFGNNQRTLFAALHTEADKPHIPEDISCIVKGAFKGEYYLKMRSENESYTDAVMRINDIWCKELFQKLPDFRFASVANDFASYYEKPVVEKTSRHILHIVSASFSDVAKSFEEGLKCICHI